jgi:acetyl-CoA carboxylase biotin carboxyl carrier protein
MDIKDIRKIVELMKENDLTEFALEEEGFRINLKRKNGGEPHVVVSQAGATPVVIAPPMVTALPGAAVPLAAPAVPAAGGAPAAAEAPPTNVKEIKSPMVGTFYRASSPEAEPFVSIGKELDEETVVCIIEAMKVMNEIKAEMKGVVRKILVENATPVEYGQALFQIEPV